MIRGDAVLRVVADVEQAVVEAAAIVLDVERAAIRARGTFRIALAGGRTPRPLYARLARDPRPDFGRWEVFFGDERMVAADHPDSNYGMARGALLEHVAIAREHVHPIPTEAGSAVAAAALYAAELRRCFNLTAGEQPRFDLVLLGMGSEGHTASLFPGSSAVTQPSTQPVVATWVEKLGAERITLTADAINAARTVVFLICGADKAAALHEVLAPDGGARRRLPHSPPARAIAPADGRLFFVVDRAAAEQLAGC